jgi:hypothetical protein
MAMAAQVNCGLCEKQFTVDSPENSTEALRQLYFHLMGDDHVDVPIEKRREEFRRARVTPKVKKE